VPAASGPPRQLAGWVYLLVIPVLCGIAWFMYRSGRSGVEPLADAEPTTGSKLPVPPELRGAEEAGWHGELARRGEPEPQADVASCPPGMTLLPAVQAVSLGEDDPKVARECGCMPHMMLAREFSVDAFCIATHPFPGEGQPWPTRAPGGLLNYGKARKIGEKLAEYDRRLCSYAEVLYASAGSENRRFPWGDEYELLCEPNYQKPKAPIGGHAGCRTPEGVFDLGARATWVTLDPETRAALEAQFEAELEDGELVVSGMHGPDGEGFAAPNNYGVHAHVISIGSFDVGRYPGDLWLDAGLRVCADPHRPDPEVEERWRAVREAFAATEDYGVLWQLRQPPPELLEELSGDGY